MKTRRMLCLVLALILALALCACGDSGDGGAITIMGKKSDLDKSYMQEIFRHYESSTGGKIKLISVEDAEFEVEAARRFENGEGPDILMHFNNADLSRFDVAEDFLYLNDQPWAGELTDSARNYCLDGEGNLLGLPYWESSVSGCYYNKTIFDSLGLKPAATQAEFDTLCEVLAQTGYTPICWPASGCCWMFQFALDPVFADDPELLSKINANETTYAQIPAVLGMAEWIDSAAARGWFGGDYMDTGWDQISPMLSSGKAVMTFIWDTWFYTDFKGGEYTVEDFALMPAFLGTADKGTYEGGNLNMMMVNKNGDRVDEALDFLKFCATPENYNVAFEGISTVSTFVGQNTNIESQMVTNAKPSIAALERVSTASTRVYGYSDVDVSECINSLLTGKTDPEGCVAMMDEKRIGEAKDRGIPGF